MPRRKRNEGYEEHNHEEWQASNPGCMSIVWHHDDQNREGMTLSRGLNQVPMDTIPDYCEEVRKCFVRNVRILIPTRTITAVTVVLSYPIMVVSL